MGYCSHPACCHEQELIFIPMSSLCRKVSSSERANLRSRSPSVTLRLITFTLRKYTVSWTWQRMASHPHCLMLIFISLTDIQKHITCHKLNEWVLHRRCLLYLISCLILSVNYNMVAYHILVPAVINRCLFCPDSDVRSFYSSVGEVNMDAVKKILADNKQVSDQTWWPWVTVSFSSTDRAVLCFSPAGERDWLVQTAQEHRSTDDVSRKDCPREAAERSVQPSHDLCAADAQQVDTSGLNSQDGVCGLHLTLQVTEAAHASHDTHFLICHRFFKKNLYWNFLLLKASGRLNSLDNF